jgi:SEC-C motif-containing protein
LRARYTAFTKRDMEYLSATLHPDTRSEHDDKQTREWAEKAEWLGLEVRATEGGGESDNEGTVEFVARYQMDGKDVDHHEVARFRRDEEEWRFVDGQLMKQKPIRREGHKIGRNDPCPCGSGKKYKKCCMS